MAATAAESPASEASAVTPAKHNKLKLREVNRHLVCRLCRGYYVDATTIAECLHSFCRSCIIKYLEKNSFCPICEVQIHKTKPYLNLRLDKALQDVVYKLVPGLYHNEMKRRREFYSKHPEQIPVAASEECGLEERIIFSPEDSISLSLEYLESDDLESETVSSQSSESGDGGQDAGNLSFPQQLGLMKLKNPNNNNNNEGKNSRRESQDVQENSSYPKRYLQCPAVVSVFHLKKFIRMKHDLTDRMQVDIIHKRVPLPDHYTLMDVAYIYTWKRSAPMRFFYQIFQTKRHKIKVPVVQSSESSSIPENAKPCKNATGGPQAKGHVSKSAVESKQNAKVDVKSEAISREKQVNSAVKATTTASTTGETTTTTSKTTTSTTTTSTATTSKTTTSTATTSKTTMSTTTTSKATTSTTTTSKATTSTTTSEKLSFKAFMTTKSSLDPKKLESARKLERIVNGIKRDEKRLEAEMEKKRAEASGETARDGGKITHKSKERYLLNPVSGELELVPSEEPKPRKAVAPMMKTGSGVTVNNRPSVIANCKRENTETGKRRLTEEKPKSPPESNGLSIEKRSFVSSLKTFRKERPSAEATDAAKEETKNSKDVAKAETKNSKDVAKAETKNSKDVTKAETKNSKDVTKAETKNGKDVAKPETKNGKDVAKPETKNSKDVAKPETNCKDVAKPETKNCKDAAKPETKNCKANGVTITPITKLLEETPEKETEKPKLKQAAVVIKREKSEYDFDGESGPPNKTTAPQKPSKEESVPKDPKNSWISLQDFRMQMWKDNSTSGEGTEKKDRRKSVPSLYRINTEASKKLDRKTPNGKVTSDKTNSKKTSPTIININTENEDSGGKTGINIQAPSNEKALPPPPIMIENKGGEYSIKQREDSNPKKSNKSEGKSEGESTNQEEENTKSDGKMSKDLLKELLMKGKDGPEESEVPKKKSKLNVEEVKNDQIGAMDLSKSETSPKTVKNPLENLIDLASKTGTGKSDENMVEALISVAQKQSIEPLLKIPHYSQNLKACQESPPLSKNISSNDISQALQFFKDLRSDIKVLEAKSQMSPNSYLEQFSQKNANLEPIQLYQQHIDLIRRLKRQQQMAANDSETPQRKQPKLSPSHESKKKVSPVSDYKPKVSSSEEAAQLKSTVERTLCQIQEQMEIQSRMVVAQNYKNLLQFYGGRPPAFCPPPTSPKSSQNRLKPSSHSPNSQKSPDSRKSPHNLTGPSGSLPMGMGTSDGSFFNNQYGHLINAGLNSEMTFHQMFQNYLMQQEKINKIRQAPLLAKKAGGPPPKSFNDLYYGTQPGAKKPESNSVPAAQKT